MNGRCGAGGCSGDGDDGATNGLAGRVLEKLGAGTNLERSEIRVIMGMMLGGRTDDAYNAAFLEKMSSKGETDDELLAMLDAMMQESIHIDTSGIAEGAIIDVCGTGGDMQQTFNVSTAASFIVGAASEVAGARGRHGGGRCAVAKHGNRSTSGVSGSADIFEMIGYDINAGPARILEILRQERVCFIFAQRFHPAMKHLAAARRSLGTRTAFNILGPLANPARVTRQLVGVSSRDLLRRIPRMLLQSGRCESAMAVMSAEGMDELSTSSSNVAVAAGIGGGMTEIIIKPEDVGLHRSESAADIRVADARQSAGFVVGAVDGTAPRPVVETAILNAAAALVVSGVVVAEEADCGAGGSGGGGGGGITDIRHAVQACREAVMGGLASKRLDSFAKSAGNPALLEGIRHGA